MYTAGWAVPSPRGTPSSAPCPSLGVLDQQAADEVLGQLAGVAEIFLIKVVVDSRDVGQGLLLCLPQERGGSAQPEGRERVGHPKKAPALSPVPSRAALYSQDVGDDPDAPGRERERRLKSHRAFGTRGDPPAQRDWLLEPWEGAQEEKHSPHIGLQPQGFIIHNFWGFRGEKERKWVCCDGRKLGPTDTGVLLGSLQD